MSFPKDMMRFKERHFRVIVANGKPFRWLPNDA